MTYGESDVDWQIIIQNIHWQGCTIMLVTPMHRTPGNMLGWEYGCQWSDIDQLP